MRSIDERFSSAKDSGAISRARWIMSSLETEWQDRLNSLREESIPASLTLARHSSFA
jgi:hypothetical protein